MSAGAAVYISLPTMMNTPLDTCGRWPVAGKLYSDGASKPAVGPTEDTRPLNTYLVSAHSSSLSDVKHTLKLIFTSDTLAIYRQVLKIVTFQVEKTAFSVPKHKCFPNYYIIFCFLFN